MLMIALRSVTAPPMRSILAALSLSLLLPLSGLGAQARSSAAAAFDPARLARIDSMVIRLIAQQKLPGAVVMLVKDGTVAYHKAYGYRDMASKAPLRRDDIFRIASQTKAITSLAAMMLWEEGKFQLDDPIATYLPEFEKQAVLDKFNPADSTYTTKPTRRRTTVRQLFTHSSGIDYADIGSDEMKAIYAKAGITALGRTNDVLAERVKVLAGLPLRAEPGERFIYSLSVDVLGRLVEVWSGMPLDVFVRTRILTPLRMPDSGFGLSQDRGSRLVTLYSETEGKLEPMTEAPFGLHPNFPVRPLTYFSGGGGMSGTTADYARFLQLFMNGGELDGVRLLSRKTVELMLTNQIPRLSMAFGLGFALETPANDYGSVVSDGTFSWGGAFNTTYWADPKEKLIALIYSNVLGSTVNLGDQFKVLVYSALR